METHDSQSELGFVFGKKLRKDLHGQRRRFGISGSGGECERPTLPTNARASTPKSGESAAFVPGPHHSSRPVLSTTPVRVHTSHHTQRSGRQIRAGHFMIAPWKDNPLSLIWIKSRKICPPQFELECWKRPQNAAEGQERLKTTILVLKNRLNDWIDT